MQSFVSWYSAQALIQPLSSRGNIQYSNETMLYPWTNAHFDNCSSPESPGISRINQSSNSRNARSAVSRSNFLVTSSTVIVEVETPVERSLDASFVTLDTSLIPHLGYTVTCTRHIRMQPSSDSTSGNLRFRFWFGSFNCFNVVGS